MTIKKYLIKLKHSLSFIKIPFLKIRDYNEKAYLKKLRKKVKNNDFTIIANNCIGGVIYHNLGKKFLSPTINVSIRGEDYLNFCQNLKYYSTCEMIDISSKEFDYPVGEIISKDNNHSNIIIYFMHDNNFEEAKEKWYKRYKRINYNNIFFIWEFYDNLYDLSLIEKYDKLNINKIALLHRKLDNINNKFVLKCYKKKYEIAKVLKYKGILGKRNLEEWDYVEWLNDNKKEG